MTWVVLVLGGLLVWLFFGTSQNTRRGKTSPRQPPKGEAQRQQAMPQPLLRVIYRDVYGDVTERDVRCLGRGDKDKFDVSCSLRNDERTFYYRGIEKCADGRTGQSVEMTRLFQLGSPGAAVPLELEWWPAWRIVCPLLIFFREWRPAGVRAREREAIQVALNALLGEAAPPDEVVAKLLRMRTSGVNLAYFSGRLDSKERAVCLEAIRACSTDDGPMRDAGLSAFS